MNDEVVNSVRVSRYVNAPRAAVYRVLLDVDANKHWRVPSGMTGQIHEFDAREGGSFRLSLTDEAPGRANKSASRTETVQGRFTRLIPNRQVVEVVQFETADPALGGELTTTTTLTDADGGTEILVAWEGIPVSAAPGLYKMALQMMLASLTALVEASSRQ
jgi:uncharacterized protein YndB with AHSA1/START domain